MKKYYSLVKEGTEATIDIYGDITSYPWFEGDVSAYNLSKQLEELTDVTQINVYINSYGGEVAEGLAIYNALKRNKAKVVTYCDGFACSIASVIFAAGDERKMSNASLLMIHNAWTIAEGNADELRKQADDLDKINGASVAAYMNIVNIEEKKLKKLMDAETWILPKEAVNMGFATEVINEPDQNVSQSFKTKLMQMIKEAELVLEPVPEPEPTPEPEHVVEPEPEPAPAEPAEPTPEPEPVNTEKEAEQKMLGFFNAISKL